MGGLAGHMSHLYDNPRLTFSDIKSILQDAAAGNLEGTEKTDGQNLYISFSVPKQELEFAEDGPKAARNKTNIKAGGMSTQQLADKFSFNPALKKSFSQALRDFGNVVKSFPKDKQIEIFGPDTNIYYNAEIINPETANVINYDSKLVSIHRGGGAEFDKETGAPVQIEITDPETGEIITGPKDVSGHAQMLSDVLEDIQQDLSDNKFKIEMDAVFNLKALEDKEALQAALSIIEDELSSEGISDSQMVIEYIMARILSLLREEGLNLDEETERLVLKRILLSNPSYKEAYGYDKMPKELDPRTILKNASQKDKNRVIYLLKNAKEILAKAIEPIEGAIHDFTVEMLRGLESLFILDNKKETERLKSEVAKAIAAIEASGHEGALEILQKQMNKLKSVENVSTAAEGFVFDHDGWSYKFTGNFAPINQILGLFKYGRAGIPPLEKLNEKTENESKRQVVLYPGRFQPMGRHHVAVFEELQNRFGRGNVYIATSDKVDPPRSPLDFDEKKEIILKHGIPEEQILNVRSPYRGDELMKYFDPETTIAIYALGAKDAGRLSMTGWFKDYEDNLNDLKTYQDHGYVLEAPHQCIILPTGEEMCGSSIRAAMKNLTPESFNDVMGWFDQDIYDMLKSKISESPTSLSETLFSLIEEVIEERSKKAEKISKKIAYLIDKEGKDKDQAAAIAYSMYDRGDLDELRTNISGFYGDPPKPRRKPKKKKYNEPTLRDDTDSPRTSKEKEEEEMELEEISAMGAGAVQGSSGAQFSVPFPGFKIKRRKSHKKGTNY